MGAAAFGIGGKACACGAYPGGGAPFTAYPGGGASAIFGKVSYEERAPCARLRPASCHLTVAPERFMAVRLRGESMGERVPGL